VEFLPGGLNGGKKQAADRLIAIDQSVDVFNPLPCPLSSHSRNQSIKPIKPINQPTNQSTIKPINQSTNRPTNQSIHPSIPPSPPPTSPRVFFRKIPLLRIFEKGSPLGAFPPQLTPLASELVVTKQYASAFFGTSLASTLTAAGVDTLLITGVSTSGCVRATATDACQHGFVPVVVRDAVGDRHQTVHESNLFDLQAKYAEVMDELRCAAYLEGL
jgi:nicotinamidase-related amidase